MPAVKVISCEGVTSTIPEQKYAVRESRVWEFEQAEIESPSFQIRTKDHSVIAGGYSYSRNWWDSKNRIVNAHRNNALKTQATSISGGVIVGGVASHYGHAFVDLLDRLASIPEAETRRFEHLAISGPVLPTVRALLFSFAPWVADKQFVDVSNATISADKILYAENSSEKPFWRHSTVLKIGRTATDRQKSIDTNLVLYISRSKAAQRRILNEATLTAAFVKKGYQLIELTPELHRLEEQIDAFRSAAVVIGAIGSGLFNIAFCSKACRLVVCLVSSDYFYSGGDNVTMLRSMCAALNLPLTFVLCEAQDAQYDANFGITPQSIATLLHLLKEIQ